MKLDRDETNKQTTARRLPQSRYDHVCRSFGVDVGTGDHHV